LSLLQALLGFVALNPTYKLPVLLRNAKPNNSRFRNRAQKVSISIRLDARGQRRCSCETTFQKLELVLSWATLHFVGWVELTSGFVGFRCTQPNLHFAGVIAKCETQQRPISEPCPKSFYFDYTGRFSGQRRRLYESPPARYSEKIERRTSNVQHRTSNECILSILKKTERSDYINPQSAIQNPKLNNPEPLLIFN
jgi:hypothetical protein